MASMLSMQLNFENRILGCTKGLLVGHGWTVSSTTVEAHHGHRRTSCCTPTGAAYFSFAAPRRCDGPGG